MKTSHKIVKQGTKRESDSGSVYTCASVVTPLGRRQEGTLRGNVEWTWAQQRKNKLAVGKCVGTAF